MESHHYLSFTISIERQKENYIAHVLNSPVGTASTVFFLPSTNERSLNRAYSLKDISHTPENSSLETQRMKFIGKRLFETIFKDAVYTCFSKCLEEVRRHNNLGLQIRVSLKNVPELMDLPWEFLYDSSADRLLVQSDLSTLVRLVKYPHNLPPIVDSHPLRILVTHLGHNALAEPDTCKQEMLLREMLAPLIAKGVVQTEWDEDASLTRLQKMLHVSEPHIVHFIGHGNTNLSNTGNRQADEWFQGNYMDEIQQMVPLLREQRNLRMVVLNDCQSIHNTYQYSFSETATALIRQGISTVVAVQSPLTDRVALAFTRCFYNALANNLSIDLAFSEAQKAIYTQVFSIEWRTPLTYTRPNSGKIPNYVDLVVMRNEPEEHSVNVEELQDSNRVSDQTLGGILPESQSTKEEQVTNSQFSQNPVQTMPRTSTSSRDIYGVRRTDYLAQPTRDLMAPDTEPTDEELALVMREARDAAIRRRALSNDWIAQRLEAASRHVKANQDKIRR